VVATRTLTVKPGAGTWYWQPKDLARGVYFLKAGTPDGESVAKVLLVE
jgi:hypothetical protein